MFSIFFIVVLVLLLLCVVSSNPVPNPDLRVLTRMLVVPELIVVANQKKTKHQHILIGSRSSGSYKLT